MCLSENPWKTSRSRTATFIDRLVNHLKKSGFHFDFFALLLRETEGIPGLFAFGDCDCFDLSEEVDEPEGKLLC